MSVALPALLRRRLCSRSAQPTAPLSCIYPNRTIYNVETPDCFFRRFTPDGLFLIAFNRSLTGLLVFRVKNTSATAQQLSNASCPSSSSSLTATNNGKSEFWHFFQLAWSQSYTTIGESLHRDLCLLSSDNRFIIAVRLRRANFAMPHTQPPPPPNSLTCIKAMEDITLLVIDVQSGRLVDSREYPSDIIYLSGHNGVSIYGDRLCLLSLKHQCLRILRISRDGRLTDLHEIGWNTRDDDFALEHALHLRDIEFERSHPEPLPRCIATKRGLSASSS
ncbi:acid phosphatase det1, partial [Coemansia aciculifera]